MSDDLDSEQNSYVNIIFDAFANAWMGLHCINSKLEKISDGLAVICPIEASELLQ